MAEVNDVFDKITDEQSFFDPTKAKKKEETKKWEPIREGDYLGHITDVEQEYLMSREMETGKQECISIQ